MMKEETKRKISQCEEITSSKRIKTQEFKSCHVCLEDCNPKKRKIISVCSNDHQFHTTCFQKWCKSSSNLEYVKCPVCRQNIDYSIFDPLRYKILTSPNFYCHSRKFPSRFKNDIPVLKILVKNNPRILINADEAVFENLEIANIVLNKKASFIEMYGQTVKNDKNIMSSLINKNPNLFIYLGNQLRSDKEFLLSIFSANGASRMFHQLFFNGIENSLQTDRDFIFECIKISPHFYRELPSESPFTSDKEIYMHVIQNDPFLFRYLPENIKKHRDVQETVIQKIPMSISVFSEDLFIHNKEIIKMALEKNGMVLQHIPREFRDYDACLWAVENCGLALQFVPFQFFQDLVPTAVSQCGYALRYCPNDYKNNEEIVRLAVDNKPDSVLLSNKRFRNNKEFMRDIVTKDPSCISLCSYSLKTDIAFLEEFIDGCTNIFGFVRELPSVVYNQYDFMKKILSIDGLCLQFLNPDLKNQHHELNEIAIRNNKYAIRFASNQCIRNIKIEFQ